MSANERIPLCLVTGFLGSGKTTLLQHLEAQRGERKLLFLVNDFPPKDIDGLRLDLDQDRLMTVAGGSVFCRCKVTDFISALRQIRRLDPRPDGVVIEASGMADPRAMGTMLAETGLERAFAWRRAIAVVDPVTLPKLWQVLPAIRSQLAVADTVLLNKQDCCPPHQTDLARTIVANAAPTAAILPCTRCAVDLDPFAAHDCEREHGDYAACVDPDYATVIAEPAGIVDWPLLKSAIERLGEAVYRAKGTIATPTGALVVDRSGHGWDERPLNDHAPSAVALAFIVRGDASHLAQALRDQIQAGVFAAAPQKTPDTPPR